MSHYVFYGQDLSRLAWCPFSTSLIILYITPIFKKGDRARAVNYRPISLTSHVIKIYERVLRKTMVNFIEDNNTLCDNQHGFRSGRSCLTQMLGHFDNIMLGLLNGHDTDAIYLDFAKAFDKVDHKLLLEKLKLWIPSTTYKVDNFPSQRPPPGSHDEWQAIIHS